MATRLSKVLALALLLSGAAHAQLYTRFGPANGILVGSTTTPQTTAATWANIQALLTGTCDSSHAVFGNGSCQSVLSGNLYAATTAEQNARIPTPGLLSLTTSTLGGTLAANTYYYVVTALGTTGETTKSLEVSITTTGSTSSNTISWGALVGASGYRVYRGTTAGGESVYYAPGNVTSYVDTGATATSGMPPATNTSAYAVTITNFTYLPGNLLRYGCVGNDSTLNDTCVAYAIDEAAVASTSNGDGGEVRIPAGLYRVANQVVWQNNLTVVGDGSSGSQIISSFSGGDQNVIRNPINSSTTANVKFENMGFGSTADFSGYANFADTGSTYLYFTNVGFGDNDIGLILDQSEIVKITNCLFEPIAVGAWLVNGSDHTPGANAGYTNNVTFIGDQFNMNSGTLVADDGGGSHTYLASSFNGAATQIRIAANQALTISDNEMEGASSNVLDFELTKLHGGTVTYSTNVTVDGNDFADLAGSYVINFASNSVQGMDIVGNRTSLNSTPINNIAGGVIGSWTCYGNVADGGDPLCGNDKGFMFSGAGGSEFQGIGGALSLTSDDGILVKDGGAHFFQGYDNSGPFMADDTEWANVSANYRGISIADNSSATNVQANTAAPSWVIDLGGRAADGSSFSANDQDAFTIFRVPPGGSYLTASGTPLLRGWNDGGITVGNPTGGDKGAGTINVPGGFYVGGALIGGASGSFTGTLTGVTTTVTGTINYRVDGNTVSLWSDSDLTGTSNANTMTITGLPAAVEPANNRVVACGNMENNSVGNQNMGQATVSHTGVVTLALLISTGQASSTNWTTSGAKGINAGWSITYPLQ